MWSKKGKAPRMVPKSCLELWLDIVALNQEMQVKTQAWIRE